MNNKLSTPSRIIITIASLALVVIYFVPVWFIYLMAPQYPEGLTMYIWLDKITGQVDIINGLNHYIGMKHIEVSMFPEFDFLIYIVAFYIICGLAVAIMGKRKFLFYYLILTVIGGVAAMLDFYKWGYDYGHNLDPKAAIQIPGFSYQPPLIGHKTLLNFDAYSYPDIGGWIIISVAVILCLVWLIEWRRSRRSAINIPLHSKKSLSAAAAFVLLTLSSCSTEPRPFQYGKDICEDCRMTIMDEKFGAQIITKKGKNFKFDDAHCIINFIKKEKVKNGDISRTVFIDYTNKNTFVDARSAIFVVAPALKSPMNSNTAAFSSQEAATKILLKTKGTVITWEQLNTTL